MPDENEEIQLIKLASVKCSDTSHPVFIVNASGLDGSLVRAIPH